MMVLLTPPWSHEPGRPAGGSHDPTGPAVPWARSCVSATDERWSRAHLQGRSAAQRADTVRRIFAARRPLRRVLEPAAAKRAAVAVRCRAPGRSVLRRRDARRGCTRPDRARGCEALGVWLRREGRSIGAVRCGSIAAWVGAAPDGASRASRRIGPSLFPIPPDLLDEQLPIGDILWIADLLRESQESLCGRERSAGLM